MPPLDTGAAEEVTLMDQVGGSGIGHANKMRLYHQQTHNAVALAAEFDDQLVTLRHDTREKM
jgi:hypothetical protein